MNFIRRVQASFVSQTPPPTDELELGLLLASVEDGGEYEPEGPDRINALPAEVRAAIFAQIDSFEERQDVQLVCQAWRDVCCAPGIYQQLYGDEAYGVVAREVLRKDHPDVLELARAKRVLSQLSGHDLASMAHQAAYYRCAKEKQRSSSVAYNEHRELYTEILNDRHEGMKVLFGGCAINSTIPLTLGWGALQATVPYLRHLGSKHTAIGVCSIAFGGPLIAVALSAACTGIVYGLDARQATRADEAAFNAWQQSLEQIAEPAFFADFEQAWRLQGDAS